MRHPYSFNRNASCGTDAVERAIYKDIPQAFGVDNPLLLERLLYTLAGQATGILSPASICSDLGGLSQATFNRYLTYLERAFLVFTLPNYSGSETSVQKRGRKVYFVDGAIRNAALQRGIAPLNDPTEMGLLLENLVAGHLHALCEESQVRFYYWREKQAEVDFIYDHPEKPMAFEVASSDGHTRAGMRAFIERFPRFADSTYLIGPGFLATRPRDHPTGIGSLPLDLFLVAVGAQAGDALARRVLGG